MALRLVPQTARFQRYTKAGLDDFGNEVAAWGDVADRNARFENFSGERSDATGQVFMSRWRVFVDGYDAAGALFQPALEDRVMEVDTGRYFTILNIEKQWDATKFHHFVVWLQLIDDD